MALGQVITVQTGTQQLVTGKSHADVPSLGLLNPNDGIVFMKLNGPAGPTPPEWDWKVPSQSYGLFPGPWQSVGLYYQDQSGSGRPGDLDLYESQDETIQIPFIQAIGRAVQSAGSTVDISQGTPPSNPPNGISRLWIDGNGHLNILQSTGVSYTVIDSNNLAANVQPIINSSITAQVPALVTSGINAQVPGMITSTALGGDLNGTVAIGHVGLANNSQLQAKTTDGVLHALAFVGTDNNTWICNAGGGTIRFINQALSVEYGHIDNSSNLLMAGTVSGNRIQSGGGVAVSPGDIAAARSSNQGVYYFGTSGGVYIYFDGTQFQINGGPLSVGTGNSVFAGSMHVGNGFASDNGLIYFNQAASVYIAWNGNVIYTSTQFQVSGNCFVTGSVYPGNQSSVQLGYNGAAYSGGSIVAGGIYTNGGADICGRVYAMQGWGGNNGGNANAFLAPNIGDNRGQGLAWQWATWSSVDHARQYGLPVEDIKDPLQLVNSISGYYYAHASMKGDEPIINPLGEVESNMTYGFAAREVNANIPEMASDEWVDTSRLIAILWEAVKELDARTR